MNALNIRNLLTPDEFCLFAEDNSMFDAVEVVSVHPASVRDWVASGRLVTSLSPDDMCEVGKYVVVCMYGVFGSYAHTVQYLAMFDTMDNALEHVHMCSSLTRCVFHSGCEYEIWHVTSPCEWSSYQDEVEYAKPVDCYVLDCLNTTYVFRSRDELQRFADCLDCRIRGVQVRPIPMVDEYPNSDAPARQFLVARPYCGFGKRPDVMRYAADSLAFVDAHSFICMPF